MIGYGSQSISDEDVAAVEAVLRGDALTCGPHVDAFEAAIAKVCGAQHAVAVSNGTSALRILYQVAGIGPGSRVGVPALTFAATASQALFLGAEVVLLDIDPRTLVVTPEILSACEEELDVVVPVHMAGRMCDMAGLAAVAEQRGWTLLEDAAHAFGTTYDGGRVGDSRWSKGAIFSFHPVKNITCGEGGAVVTNDPDWAARLRSLRHHGIARAGFRGPHADRDGSAPWYHEFHEIAGNERLSDLHAALGSSQLRRLDAFKAERTAIHGRYAHAFRDHPHLRPPPPTPGQEPFWHLYSLWLDFAQLELDRVAFFAEARERGFALQVHYIPLHHQPVFAGLARASGLAGVEEAYRGLVSLPCFVGLPQEEQERLIGWVSGLGA